RLGESGDWLVLPWCMGQVAPSVAVGHVQTSSMSMPAAARTAGAMIALNCNMIATARSRDKRRRTNRMTRPEYHFPTIPSLDTGKAQRETGAKGRVKQPRPWVLGRRGSRATHRPLPIDLERDRSG